MGNVFVKTSEWTVARMGGDGTGETGGRYRFVNNTFLLGASTNEAFAMQDSIESVEMHNNVFVQTGGSGASVYTDSDAVWKGGTQVLTGSGNWIQNGIQNVPQGFTGTLRGADAGFVKLATFDVEPTQKSPLVDAGVDAPASPAGHEFPNPLAAPLFVPPLRTLNKVGMASPRQSVGTIRYRSLRVRESGEHGSRREHGADGLRSGRGGRLGGRSRRGCGRWIRSEVRLESFGGRWLRLSRRRRTRPLSGSLHRRRRGAALGGSAPRIT